MANFNFNQVIIGGKLTKDPELKQTASGLSTTTFTVAVNRKGQQNGEQKADFFNVTAWRKTAEVVCQYFRKGSTICVTGTLQNRSWEGNDGQKHFVTEIVANNVDFVDSKAESPASGNSGGYIPGAYSKPQTAPKMEQIDLDDGDGEILPF